MLEGQKYKPATDSVSVRSLDEGINLSMTLPHSPSTLFQQQQPPLGTHSSNEHSPPNANTSPHGSPRYSQRQTLMKDKVETTRDPSPYHLEKPEPVDVQDSSLSKSSDSIQPPEFVRSASHDSGKERKESRGSDRSKKKSSWYSSVLNPTYKSRSDEFKRYFKDVPNDERLIVDYSCALQKDILVHGRLYVTQNYLCFYANIFRWETCACIKWKDVTAVTKEKTALVIPNAILVSLDTEKHFFTTFGTRDKAYMMLFRVWQNALMDQPMSTQEMWQWVHTAYGEELGLTSDDEDYNYIPPGPPLEDKMCSAGVRLSADSLTEEGGRAYPGQVIPDKGDSELGSSTTDSTNKSHSSNPAQMFLPVNSPPPGVLDDHLPTDLSDTSESEPDRNNEPNSISCMAAHEGRLLINTVLPVHVDQLFTLLFTNSKFFVEFHAMRRTTDIKMSSWQQTPDSDEKIRTVSMKLALNQTLGPKSSDVQETQVMNRVSKPGFFYSIDGEAVNSGIPYADSFYVMTHTCMTRTGQNQTSFSIYAEIKYKKSVWGFVKNLIEKNTWAGLEEFHDSLLKALHSESDGTLMKGRKSRPRRGMVTKPVLLPVDELPASAISTAFKKVGARSEGEKTSDSLLRVVLAVLVFLVILNCLLYYKLWLLEEWTQLSSRSGIIKDLAYLEILKDPPKTHEEWLDLLRHQESLHRLELSKWQKILQSAVSLLRRAEESLNLLEGSIRSSYAEGGGANPHNEL